MMNRSKKKGKSSKCYQFIIFYRSKITQIRAELIEQLRASVIHMIHTPDGARCGLHCIWFGSAKDRKLILKTIKEFIDKVLTAEYGHLLVLGTIDSGTFSKISNRSRVIRF